jgi:hypothetical protein
VGLELWWEEFFHDHGEERRQRERNCAPWHWPLVPAAAHDLVERVRVAVVALITPAEEVVGEAVVCEVVARPEHEHKS